MAKGNGRRWGDGDGYKQAYSVCVCACGGVFATGGVGRGCLGGAFEITLHACGGGRGEFAKTAKARGGAELRRQQPGPGRAGPGRPEP